MIVNFSRSISTSGESTDEPTASSSPLQNQANDALRLAVQQTFTALLASTSSVSTTANRPAANRRTTSRLRPIDTSVFSPSDPEPSPAAPSPPPRPQKPQQAHSHSFLRILRTLLLRLSSPATSITTSSGTTLSSLRSILMQIFSAYTFESSLLDIATTFLDRDVFLQLEAADRARRRGWVTGKVAGSGGNGCACEACGRRVWGKGLGTAAWEAWRERRDERAGVWAAKWGIDDAFGVVPDDGGMRGRLGGSQDANDEGDMLQRRLSAREKGKGRSRATTPSPGLGSSSHIIASTGGAETSDVVPGNLVEAASFQPPALDALVVFACSHVYHRTCLERLMGERHAAADAADEEADEGWKCLMCTGKDEEGKIEG